MRDTREKITIALVALAIILTIAFPKWHAYQRELELKREKEIETEIRKMMDHNTLDNSTIAEMFATPSEPLDLAGDPIYQVSPTREIVAPSFNELSNQFERDQIRRDLDSLKRQVDMDRINRDIQRREDEQKAQKSKLEHSLGLDHPQ